ncbi:hypothetical protein AX14_012370, partial [Amanita brunnescens Koide BX004]
IQLTERCSVLLRVAESYFASSASESSNEILRCSQEAKKHSLDPDRLYMCAGGSESIDHATKHCQRCPSKFADIMKNATLTILTLTLAQLYLSATAFLVPRGVITGSLVTRQGQGNGNGTLSQCESPCSSVDQFVGPNAPDTCTPQACCTADFEQAYLNCFTCIGTAENITDYSQYQSSLDNLTSACLEEGINVPKLTFPGQNPNRSLPTPSSTLASSSATGVPGTTMTSTTTPGTTILPTTGVVATTTPSPTTVRNIGAKNTGTKFSPLLFLLLGILMS